MAAEGFWRTIDYSYAGMHAPFGKLTGSGKIPCLQSGDTDASVAKKYPDLGSNWVTEVQKKLQTHFFGAYGAIQASAGVTWGKYDSGTVKLVKDYQKDVGFKKSGQDGIVGPNTYTKLFGSSSRYLSCPKSSPRPSSSTPSSSPPAYQESFFEKYKYPLLGAVLLAGVYYVFSE